MAAFGVIGDLAEREGTVKKKRFATRSRERLKPTLESKHGMSGGGDENNTFQGKIGCPSN